MIAIKVLMVEDDLDFAALLKLFLSSSEEYEFVVENTNTITETLDILNHETFDIILLDLNLPDCKELDTFNVVSNKVANTPIVIVTAIQDEQNAFYALQKGAQDYINKKIVSAGTLIKSITYAIERHKRIELFRAESLIDNLTGFYNYIGFQVLAEEYIEYAKRKKEGYLIGFFAVNEMEKVLDEFGKGVCSYFILKLSEVFRESFRKSDLISRYGDDEFVILFKDTLDESKDIIVEKIISKLNEFNSSSDVDLSLSCGFIYHDNKEHKSIDELVELSKKNMYISKKSEYIENKLH